MPTAAFGPHDIVRFVGATIIGATLSCTVIVDVDVLIFPHASIAVNKYVNVRSVILPLQLSISDTKDWLMVTEPPHPSVAVAVANHVLNDVLKLAVQDTVVFAGGIKTGAVSSNIIKSA